MANKLVPLNGTKTHPLTPHAMGELRRLSYGPAPRQTFNAGVSDRFAREGLAVVVSLPSPYAIHRGAKILHLQITEAGRAALASSAAG